ncbi:putative membrane protein [Vibrio phage vB_VchM_Kuja]|uniref:Putative membrane protein n=1 Tax=Vibrio phage vB_VchM_Kuja TaxID=2686437 RepID=A0A6B9J923_9CAUD|nr:hypothetical protein HWC83_gp042 [Vibrio phage vB_VchM_Kuja]QGZ16033.1 putative membrane protein [Vibrio phage vB_VchM_Kuja]
MFYLEYIDLFVRVVLIILITITSQKTVHNILVLYRANSVENETKLKNSLFTVSNFDTSELKNHNTYTNLVNEKIKIIPYQISSLLAMVFVFFLLG